MVQVVYGAGEVGRLAVVPGVQAALAVELDAQDQPVALCRHVATVRWPVAQSNPARNCSAPCSATGKSPCAASSGSAPGLQDGLVLAEEVAPVAPTELLHMKQRRWIARHRQDQVEDLEGGYVDRRIAHIRQLARQPHERVVGADLKGLREMHPLGLVHARQDEHARAVRRRALVRLEQARPSQGLPVHPHFRQR